MKFKVQRSIQSINVQVDEFSQSELPRLPHHPVQEIEHDPHSRHPLKFPSQALPPSGNHYS